MPLLLLKITALLALTLAFAGMLRRCSAALRHLICASGMAGSLVLALTLLAPDSAPAFRIATLSLPNAVSIAQSAPAWSAVLLWKGLPWLWLTGTLFLLARLAVGYARIARLTAGITQEISFAEVSVPVVVGLSRPRILLPLAAEAWPAAARDAAIRHERAHIRRGDLWTLLVTRVACAVYWFHPLIWILSAQLRREQEQACDDAVILSGMAPDLYADALIMAAQRLTAARLLGCPMIAHDTFRQRVFRVLSKGLPRSSRTATLRAAALACGCAVLALGFVGGQPSVYPTVYKVGHGVSAPRVLSQVQPSYTDQAKKVKRQGPVLLSVVVGGDGLAHDIKVVRSLGGGLDEKAIEAVQKWHFQPGKKDGSPVAVRAQIEINFRLL